MRALHIFASPRLTNGATVFEYRVAERLCGDGICFDYLVTQPPTPEEEARYARTGSRVYCLNLDEKHGLLVRELRANRAYYRFFREHPYPVVYADTENALRAVHLLMARLAGVKVRVVHSHNTGLQTNSRLSHWLSRRLRALFLLSATDYFACSDAAAAWLFPKRIVRERRYEILKNGIDLERFRFDPTARARLRDELGLGDGLVVGSVGRFMPQKNQRFLIDILGALLPLRPDARLLLVGDGPLREELIARAREKGVLDRLILPGEVNNVPDYLCTMDVFALPSAFEGLGIVNIEAQAAGLPCLMSEAVPREAAVTGRADFLSLDAGPEGWARRLCELAEAFPERADTHAEIRAAGYSIETTAARLRRFYLEKGGDGAC